VGGGGALGEIVVTCWERGVPGQSFNFPKLRGEKKKKLPETKGENRGRKISKSTRHCGGKKQKIKG